MNVEQIKKIFYVKNSLFNFQWYTDNVSICNGAGLCLLVLFVAVMIQMIKSHVSEKYDEERTLPSFSYCQFIVRCFMGI